MEELGNFSATQEVLLKHSFVLKKKYGQNFLIDTNILEKILSLSHIGPEDIVLEIGPGIGTLTRHLAARAKHVVAVEIDEKLLPVLHDTLSEFENVTIVGADIMKFDIDAYFEEHFFGEMSCKVVANLPYYITTPVLMKLLEGKTAFSEMLFMVQKEVAERIAALPGTENYGALTLAAAYYADVTICGTVSPSCFLPRPKVESALMHFSVYKEKPGRPADEAQLFALIRAAFNQRRKTLVNAVGNFEGLNYTKEEVRKALLSMDLSETIRGEALSLAQFAALSDALTGMNARERLRLTGMIK